MRQTRKQRRSKKSGGAWYNPGSWFTRKQSTVVPDLEQEQNLTESQRIQYNPQLSKANTSIETLQSRPLEKMVLPKKPQGSFMNRILGRKVVQQATIPFQKVSNSKANYVQELETKRKRLTEYQELNLSDYESMYDAYQREFRFLYEMMKKKDEIDKINKQFNATKTYATQQYKKTLTFKLTALKNKPLEPYSRPLTNKEKSELKERILSLLAFKNGMFVIHDTMNETLKALTGIDNDVTFNELLNTYIKTKAEPSTQPFNIAARNKIPTLKTTTAASYFSRLIRVALYTDDELRRTTDADKTQCVNLPYNNSTDEIHKNVCVLVNYSIPDMLYHISQGNYVDSYASALYMVIQPKYHPKASEQKYTGKAYYDTTVNEISPRITSIALGAFPISKVVKDVLENGGLELVHPRLGCMLQLELSDLWNIHYFNPSNIDLTDRIVLLTLQKYAAIRRYTWTKDPVVTSQIYEADPKAIAYELLNFNSNHTNYKFNRIDFYNEFRKNQLWAGGKVRYVTYDDIHLKTLIMKVSNNTSSKNVSNNTSSLNTWYNNNTYVNEEQTLIEPIPEEKMLDTINITNAVPFTGNNQEEENEEENGFFSFFKSTPKPSSLSQPPTSTVKKLVKQFSQSRIPR